ncbi:MAG: hypothetical protein GY847_02435 [Proteobacteria bacterium]|nr:hypothetical protein [Pseudomonadota bacterium]
MPAYLRNGVLRARAIISPHFRNADPSIPLGVEARRVGARRAVPLQILCYHALSAGRLDAWKK